MKLDNNNKEIAGNKSQKLKLLARGNAISGQPNKIGANQLLYAPINMGIVIIKIITKAWDVTITLYN
jgi:hypothetical protein